MEDDPPRPSDNLRKPWIRLVKTLTSNHCVKLKNRFQRATQRYHPACRSAAVIAIASCILQLWNDDEEITSLVLSDEEIDRLLSLSMATPELVSGTEIADDATQAKALQTLEDSIQQISPGPAIASELPHPERIRCLVRRLFLGYSARTLAELCDKLLATDIGDVARSVYAHFDEQLHASCIVIREVWEEFPTLRNHGKFAVGLAAMRLNARTSKVIVEIGDGQSSFMRTSALVYSLMNDNR